MALPETVRSILDDLETRFAYILDPKSRDFQPLYSVATLLDPNFTLGLQGKLNLLYNTLSAVLGGAPLGRSYCTVNYNVEEWKL